MKRVTRQPGSLQGGPAGADVEALVAKYAPAGRRLRRERIVRRTAVAMTLPVVAALGFQAWQWATVRLDTPASAAPAAADRGATEDAARRVESALAEFRELKAQVNAETGALSAQRDELARQRQRFEERSAALIQQLAAVNAQGATLAGQMQRFEDQRAQLEQTLARVDAERRSLETRQARAGQAAGAAVDQQLAEIVRQRRSLEEQQQEVQKQGRLLAQEIDRINSQRLELEKQRQAIEQQRTEVQGLLNQIREVGLNRLREKKRSIEEAAAHEEAVAKAAAPSPLATMAAVGDGVLGEMRGGIDTSEDYTVSIGVTRTGSVNGIEQFSSALYLDDLTKANGPGLAQIDAVMVQNGVGNLVTPDTAANLSQNVTTIIQNTLDNQALSSQTILDISLQNVSAVTQGISASQTVSESLSLQR